ncbi:MAG TPA: NUDIX domain-containing protein [Crocinitomicaceae bacterium]|nr:NUDIX domain-containing protein [Crocinitomicaceae bacterium]
MYKVFIDHKPILFVNHSEFSDNFNSIDALSIENLEDDLSSEMEFISLDTPLQILCQNIEDDFLRLFADYELIEAAGGVVRNQKGILMIYRNGLWDIPKGKLEKREDVKTAAIREVEEECGIEQPIIEDWLIDTYHIYVYKGRKVLKKTFWYSMKYSGNKKLIPQIEEGITDVKWMSAEEFLKVRGKTYGSINEVIDVYAERFLLGS